MADSKQPGRIIIGDAGHSARGLKVNFVQPPDLATGEGSRPNDFVGIGPNGEHFPLDTFPMIVEITDDGAEFNPDSTEEGDSGPYTGGSQGRSWKEVFPVNAVNNDGFLGPVGPIARDGYEFSTTPTFPAIEISGRRDVPTGYRTVAIQSKLAGSEANFFNYTAPAILAGIPAVLPIGFDGFAGDGTPQYRELGAMFLNLPQDQDRIYLAVATCNVWVNSFQNDDFGTSSYPPMPLWDNGTGKYDPVYTGSEIICYLYVTFQRYDSNDPPSPVEPPYYASAHLFSINTYNLTRMTIPSVSIPVTDSHGDTETVVIPAATYFVPVVAGLNRGSATAILKFNSKTDEFAVDPSAAPDYGVFAEPIRTRVSFGVMLNSYSFAGKINLEFNRAPAWFPFEGGFFNDQGSYGYPHLYVLQTNRIEPEIAPPEPSPPPPPPPPGTHIETITITKSGLSAESYIVTVKHGSTTDDVRTAPPKLPYTYALNLPDNTYTVTIVGALTGHVYTVTTGTFVMAGADASTTQAIS